MLTIFIIFMCLPSISRMCMRTHMHTYTRTFKFGPQVGQDHSLFTWSNKLTFSCPRPFSYKYSFYYESNYPSRASKLLSVIFNFLPFAC